MAKASNNCLWEKVASELVTHIEKSNLKPGSKFFSADEVSERFNVSNITSRRALSELANMNLIEKSRGRGCVVKEKHAIETIFILGNDEIKQPISLQSFVYSELYKGILNECRRHNINTKVISTQLFNNFPENTRMDLILMQNFPTHLPEITKRLSHDANINCVCCHALNPIEGIGTVRSDLGKGAYDAVSHMIKNGHKRVALIGIGTTGWSASRFDGYYQALKDNKIDFDANIVETAAMDERSHFDAIDKLMRKEEPPTAIFALSDANALFVLEYCQQNGLKTPDDLALIGFDNTPESALANPSLTTVDAMLEEEGKEAVRLLMLNLPKNNIKDITLKPELIVRKSA